MKQTRSRRRRAITARLGVPQHRTTRPTSSGASSRRDSRSSEILAVNAAPGFSEHHTGEAVDIATPGTRPLTAEFDGSAAFRLAASERRQRSVSACRTGAAIASGSCTSRGIGRKSSAGAAPQRRERLKLEPTIHQQGDRSMHLRLLRCSRPWAPRSRCSPRARTPPRRFASGNSRRAARRSSSRCAK